MASQDNYTDNSTNTPNLLVPPRSCNVTHPQPHNNLITIKAQDFSSHSRELETAVIHAYSMLIILSGN